VSRRSHLCHEGEGREGEGRTFGATRHEDRTFGAIYSIFPKLLASMIYGGFF